jgi:isoquinoline 1-oxidoreductase beta subunit
MYGIDTRLDGMLYAVVARPAVYGGRVVSHDASEALKVPGVVRVVQIPGTPPPSEFQPLGGVAVIATNTWAAIQGRNALKIQWDDGPNASYDSMAYKAALETATRNPAQVVRNDGCRSRSLPRRAPESRPVREHSADAGTDGAAGATAKSSMAAAKVGGCGGPATRDRVEAFGIP